ncbi:Glycoside hydrolase, partial [Phytophthora palmivora]
VVYGLPPNDCDAGYSNGNGTVKTGADYKEFITNLTSLVGERKVLYVLEPDAVGLLANKGCAVEYGYQSNLTTAISLLSANPNAEIYLDVGFWTLERSDTADIVAQIVNELAQTGRVKGIALNTSNYRSTTQIAELCTNFQKAIGSTDMTCVIDTSRNFQEYANASSSAWCNVRKAGIGAPPTNVTDFDNIDYWVYVKPPGDSDGTCVDQSSDSMHGPQAGEFFNDHFIKLWNQGYFVNAQQMSTIYDPNAETSGSAAPMMPPWFTSIAALLVTLSLHAHQCRCQRLAGVYGRLSLASRLLPAAPADSKKTPTAKMFRKFAVCTAVLVAVLTNDALALQQGGSFTPTTGGNQDDSYTTTTKGPVVTQPPSVPATTAPAVTPATTTPAPEVTPATPVSTPAATTPAPETPITEAPIATPASTPTTPSIPTTGTKAPSVTPAATTPTSEEGSHQTDVPPSIPTTGTKAPSETPAATTPTSEEGSHQTDVPPSVPTTGTKPPSVTPTATTPTAEQGSHQTDCNPNFPTEETEAPVATPTATTATPAVTPAATTATPDVTPAATTPTSPKQGVVTPAPTTSTDVESSASKTNSASTTEDSGSDTIDQTAQQATTKSGEDSNKGGNSTVLTFCIIGAVAAVAAVGVAASRMKNAREADAALATPGDNENIHIEIKRTPAGGSTIL